MKKSELIAFTLGVSAALISVTVCGLFVFFVTLSLHEDVAATFATKNLDSILETTTKLHVDET